MRESGMRIRLSKRATDPHYIGGEQGQRRGERYEYARKRGGFSPAV